MIINDFHIFFSRFSVTILAYTQPVKEHKTPYSFR